MFVLGEGDPGTKKLRAVIILSRLYCSELLKFMWYCTGRCRSRVRIFLNILSVTLSRILPSLLDFGNIREAESLTINF